MKDLVLKRDARTTQHGRRLYRVFVSETYVGSVARWGRGSWGVVADWLPPSQDPDERFTSRAQAVDMLVALARLDGPLKDES